MADYYLDCRGLQCPQPIIEISKLMRRLECGQTLLVEAKDPAFRADVEAWVAMRGQRLVRTTSNAQGVSAIVEKT